MASLVRFSRPLSSIAFVLSFGFNLILFAEVDPTQLDARLRNIDKLLEKKDWEGSYGEIVRLEKELGSPDYVKGFNLYSRALRVTHALNRGEETRLYLDRLKALADLEISRCKDDGCKAYYHLNMANLYADVEQFDAALEFYRKARAIGPRDDHWLRHLDGSIQNVEAKSEKALRRQEFLAQQARIDFAELKESELRQFYSTLKRPVAPATERPLVEEDFVGYVSERGNVFPVLSIPGLDPLTLSNSRAQLDSLLCTSLKTSTLQSRVSSHAVEDQFMCGERPGLPLETPASFAKSLVLCSRGRHVVKAGNADRRDAKVIKSSLNEQRSKHLHPSLNTKNQRVEAVDITSLETSADANLYFVEETLTGRFCSSLPRPLKGLGDLAIASIVRVHRAEKVQILWQNRSLYCGGERSYGLNVSYQGMLPIEGDRKLIFLDHIGYEGLENCVYELMGDRLELRSCGVGGGC
ncbi:tetratricopeptide repeat protein [Oligoflexus tunisiensis]|uniref:tetratricopeptide repeat protein n=1 Tax=Oligoflexus tunisiensis TaxID=708132 RepID=UPI00114CBBF6|nr:tetratricopeptide repeat protein [Oligoflexus tunisiensis]